MTDAPAEAVEPPGSDGLIGIKIRQRRLELGLSLKEISADSGLSIGLLSQIERGISSPTVRALRLISETLRVSPSWFFEPVPTTSPETGIVVRRERRRTITYAEGITKELLTDENASGIELLLVRMEPGATSGDEPYVHPGDEAGHVIAGRLRLFVGIEVFVLREGDSFRFKSTIPHRFENAGERQTQVLWALSAPMYV